MKKKMQLNADELSVESYATPAPEPIRGTVQGADASVATGCPRCGTVMVIGSCYNGCTEEFC